LRVISVDLASALGCIENERVLRTALIQ